MLELFDYVWFGYGAGDEHDEFRGIGPLKI